MLPRESCIRLYDILCDCKDSGEAKQKIMEFFEFTEEQAEYKKGHDKLSIKDLRCAGDIGEIADLIIFIEKD